MGALTEHQEQCLLIKWLRVKKIKHFAVPNANALSSQNKMMAIRIANKLRSEGVASGVSDLVIMLPLKILFIEMKKAPKILKSGKLSYSGIKTSDNQKVFLESVNTLPYALGYVAYGWIEAKSIIENELRAKQCL